MRKTILLLLSVSFVAFWAYLKLANVDPDATLTTVFSSSYIVIALTGGIFGLAKARMWGGFSSMLGKALSFFSLGLIATTIGSFILTYFNVIKEEAPSYPSVAEIFYVGGILLYILGTVYVAKTLRSWSYIRKKSALMKTFLLLTPVIMVGISIARYTTSYDATEVPTMVIATDYIYAFSQAIYAIFAISALLTSGQLYGGYLRKAVIILLLGLILQYAADTNYSYQTLSETWVTAGYGELLYLLAYSLTAFSLQLFEKPKQLSGEKSNG